MSDDVVLSEGRVEKAKEIGGKVLGLIEKKTFCSLLGRVRNRFVKEMNEAWREAGYKMTEQVKNINEIAQAADELHKYLCE